MGLWAETVKKNNEQKLEKEEREWGNKEKKKRENGKKEKKKRKI